MNKIEIKKDLYKSKNVAEFSHYVYGNLYYNVMLSTGFYQFPISVVDEYMQTLVTNSKLYKLSEDLGTTLFHDKIKGSELIRWIDKAIDNDSFIKIS